MKFAHICSLVQNLINAEFPLPQRLLTTQTATDLRGICGNGRFEKCWKANEMEQKRPKMNRKYYKKFQISVGKDEVSGSNPDSSSIETLESQRIQGFSIFFQSVGK